MSWIPGVDTLKLIGFGLAAASMLGFVSYEVVHQRSVGEARATARYESALSRQKLDAANLLADQIAKTRSAEQKLNAALAAQEKTDANNSQTVAKLRDDLRAKSRAAGGPGLRDPFAPRCGSGSARPAGTALARADGGSGNEAPAGRVLSSGFERLLLDWAERADAINIAYGSCRADSLNIRAINP